MTLAVLESCEKANVQEVIDEIEQSQSLKGEKKKFTFTVKGDFLNPEFHEGTRANAYMTADGAEMTDMWIIDYKDGEILQSLHQTNTDTDWGSPSMSLTLGTHHVLFLASRGQEPQYQNGVVTWTKPLDTFYLDYEVTVVKTSNGNRAVTLNRVSTRMQLSVNDKLENGTTSLTLIPELWYNGWDMLNAQPIATDDYGITFSISSSMWGRTGLTLNMWGLSSDEEWETNVEVTSKAGENVNAYAMIPDAPFVANRTTIYRGNLYSNQTDSHISLSSEWLSDYEGIY